MSGKPPRVLLSYSWDSEEHKAWVRNFAERLRFNGINAILDQWHVKPGESLTQFMEAEIVKCSKVLIICTPEYYRKSLSREGGVGYEQQIISGHIVSGENRCKFIPIVREGGFTVGADCSIPPHFTGIYAIDLRSDDVSTKELEVVLRAIFGEQEHTPPEIGNKPNWNEVSGSSDFHNLRLPTMDKDGYELSNAEIIHQENPDTFYLPPEEHRANLLVGDSVKLIFQIAIEDEELGNVLGERMWVRVKGKIGPYYIGNLDNNPLTSSEQDNIIYDDMVIFLPEHVIDIHEPEDEKETFMSKAKALFSKLPFLN